jgi:hypothetical protein
VKRIALGLATLALLAGCGSDGGNGGGSGGDELTVQLGEQNGSMQSGEAVLTRIDDSSTHVVLSIDGGGDTPQPAHIHKGSCAQLDPQPEYGLENVVDGESSTHVNVSLDELRDGDYAINVHKSADALRIYVACGDIGSGGSMQTETDAETETDSDGYGY